MGMANVIIGIFIAMVTGRLIELRSHLRIFSCLVFRSLSICFFLFVIRRASNAVCIVNEDVQ